MAVAGASPERVRDDGRCDDHLLGQDGHAHDVPYDGAWSGDAASCLGLVWCCFSVSSAWASRMRIFETIQLARM